MKDKPKDDMSPILEEEVPKGVDRRTFLMRTAVVGAVAVITGCKAPEKPEQAAAAAAPPAPTSPTGPTAQNLDVVMRSKGPVMTLIDEFFKVGPGPSSSTPSGRCASPTTSTSAAPSCPRISWPKRRA